jgi:hypothetical protein
MFGLLERNRHRIVNLVADECVIFGTANRAPYLLFLEVVSEHSEALRHEESHHHSHSSHHSHSHHPHLHAAGAFIAAHLDPKK